MGKIHGLFKQIQQHRMKPDGTNYELTAGTTDTPTSDAVDTLGYDGVSFTLLLGAITATGTINIKLQHSADNGVLDAFADMAGTNQAVAAANQFLMVQWDFFRPAKRYIRAVATRATANSAIDGLVAHLWGALNLSVPVDATILSQKFFNSAQSGAA